MQPCRSAAKPAWDTRLLYDLCQFRIEQFVEWTRSGQRRAPTETVETRFFHTSTPPYLHTLIRHGNALIATGINIHRQNLHTAPAGLAGQGVGREEAHWLVI